MNPSLPWVLFVTILAISLGYFLRSYFQKKNLSSSQAKTLLSLQERNKAFAATRELNHIILQTLDFDVAVQKIANAIPQYLGYQTGVLALVDEQVGVLKRVAISETSGGRAALASLEIPFETIEISLEATQNYCIKALKENITYSTTNLYDVLTPAVSKENAAIVQEMMGTKTTLIYPLYTLDNKPLGTFLISMDKKEDNLTEYEKETISNFVDGIRIALVNASLFTSLEETSKQLAAANQRLKELDRLKDDFVSIASHELRTPMTAIRSYVWMALNKPDIALSLKMKKYLSRTLSSTERLINLVNDMLNVSRIEAGLIEIFPKPLDILALSADVFEEVRPKADEKGLKLNILQDKIPAVFADENKVHQVLLNLVGNAIKFTPERGQIAVSVKVIDQMAEVSVSDTGTGIAKADLESLFKKFSRLGSSYVSMNTSGGTGLGLYISKNLIELMHGKIWAKSEGPGKGSTFTFSLPIATDNLIKEAEKYHIKPQTVKELEPAAI